MAIYLVGDGYRWHPWAHSNPIKQELHLRRHDQLDSAGNSREAQNISWNKNECQLLSSQWRLQIHFKKTFLGCTIMKTFNESLVYLKSNLEEMIGQWLNYNMNERASNYRSMCLQLNDLLTMIIVPSFMLCSFLYCCAVYQPTANPERSEPDMEVGWKKELTVQGDYSYDYKSPNM